MKLDNEYAAILLIEILYKKNLINNATYDNVMKYKRSHIEKKKSHISQAA